MATIKDAAREMRIRSIELKIEAIKDSLPKNIQKKISDRFRELMDIEYLKDINKLKF